MIKRKHETVFQRELDQLRGLQIAARAEDISKKNLQIMVNYMITLAVKVIRDSTKLAQISDINERRLLRAQKALRERKTQLEAALAEVKNLTNRTPVCANCKYLLDEKTKPDNSKPAES